MILLMKCIIEEVILKFYILLQKKRNFTIKIIYIFCKIYLNYLIVPHREKHQALVEKYENKDNLIFGGSLFPNEGAFLLFNCADERTPYDFVKEVTFYTGIFSYKYLIYS